MRGRRWCGFVIAVSMLATACGAQKSDSSSNPHGTVATTSSTTHAATTIAPSTTTTTDPTARSGAVAVSTNISYHLLSEMADRTKILNAVGVANNLAATNLAMSQRQARAIADAAIAYREFLRAQLWPPVLGADATAVETAMDAYVAGFHDIESLRVYDVPRINADLGRTGLAARLANEADKTLRRDILDYMCVYRDLCDPVTGEPPPPLAS